MSGFFDACLWAAAAGIMVLTIGASGADFQRSDVKDGPRIFPADTVTVVGQVVAVGSEPFTRLRLVQKGGGGYILQSDEAERIDLRRQGPTNVRIVGVSFVDVWQGQEVPHLRVIRWTSLDR
jgi:hypothetical protein